MRGAPFRDAANPGAGAPRLRPSPAPTHRATDPRPRSAGRPRTPAAAAARSEAGTRASCSRLFSARRGPPRASRSRSPPRRQRTASVSAELARIERAARVRRLRPSAPRSSPSAQLGALRHAQPICARAAGRRAARGHPRQSARAAQPPAGRARLPLDHRLSVRCARRAAGPRSPRRRRAGGTMKPARGDPIAQRIAAPLGAAARAAPATRQLHAVARMPDVRAAEIIEQQLRLGCVCAAAARHRRSGARPARADQRQHPRAQVVAVEARDRELLGSSSQASRCRAQPARAAPHAHRAAADAPASRLPTAQSAAWPRCPATPAPRSSCKQHGLELIVLGGDAVSSSSPAASASRKQAVAQHARAAASSDSPRRRDTRSARALNGTRERARHLRGVAAPGRRARAAGRDRCAARAAECRRPGSRASAASSAVESAPPLKATHSAACAAVRQQPCQLLAQPRGSNSLILGRTGRRGGLHAAFSRTRRSPRSLRARCSSSWSRGDCVELVAGGGSCAALRAAAIATGSRCAPPSGSSQHLIHQPELREPVGGEAHRIGRDFLLVCALPQDRGAALRARSPSRC